MVNLGLTLNAKLTLYFLVLFVEGNDRVLPIVSTFIDCLTKVVGDKNCPPQNHWERTVMSIIPAKF